MGSPTRLADHSVTCLVTMSVTGVEKRGLRSKGTMKISLWTSLSRIFTDTETYQKYAIYKGSKNFIKYSPGTCS